MAAIDTVAGVATIGAGPVWTALTTAPGDSLQVRAFPQAGSAFLYMMSVKSPHAAAQRVRSPRLHDNVTGINLRTGETVAARFLTDYAAQNLISTDTLIEELNGTAADVNGGLLGIYYTQLPGSDGRYHSWGDIKNNIKNLKPFEVACTNSAAAGTWTDTLITATEDQLHANTDYAVLGYNTDTNVLGVGVKGQETGNLRAGGPGTTSTLRTDNYFVGLSEDSGMPMIPVFNSNNKGSFYVSTVDSIASTTPTVTLVCAELINPVTP